MNYLYAIMTQQGFQMRGAEAAVYMTQEEAEKHMGSGDSLVPIEDNPHGNYRHHALLGVRKKA